MSSLPNLSKTEKVIQSNNTLNQNILNQDLIIYNHATYALTMFGYFTAGIVWILPIIMNYAKRDEARHTWLYSHFDWQIKTFWYGVFFGGIGLVLMVFGFSVSFIGMVVDNHALFGGSGLVGVVGGLMFVAVLIWHFYRTVRGWIALNNRKAVP
ncbi:putative transmembrane protein [Moraxella macacae 0408225]|uniref:Putative transmembrane protein n=1 Tax=Moraxella macacae 0408225 TaxID=1230338 RepID=L2F5D5_9GAMM|nr:putative transmembrane protein [Moraxella macacae]ELA08237.1 putative transmembrane protein [Moraxella macacae 0408225]